MPRLLVALVATALLAAPAPAADAIAEGKAFLTRYIALSNSYSPAIADLYADDAVLSLTARLPDESSQQLELSGAQYKALLPKALPVARRKDERVVFSDIRYTAEGDRIRITALRHALTDGYSVPHAMVIARDGGGRWIVVEETGETRVGLAPAEPVEETAAPAPGPEIEPPAPAPAPQPAAPVQSPAKAAPPARPARKPAPAPPAPRGDAAAIGQGFLDVLIARNNAYDPTVADLYADDAKLKVTLRDPDGSETTIRRTGKQTKAEVHQWIAMAKRQGAQMSFTDARYSTGGRRIRITGKTRDARSGVVAPHTLVIARDARGQWVVVEESVVIRAPAKGAADVR